MEMQVKIKIECIVFLNHIVVCHNRFSSDEAEIKEEVEDSDVLENGYEGDLPSPVIPSSLLEVQVKEKGGSCVFFPGNENTQT